MSTYINVTSWSARKRHLATPLATHTLCQTKAVRPGALCVGQYREPITQDRIDGLELCKPCARKAGR
jgi:hypothetical protein